MISDEMDYESDSGITHQRRSSSCCSDCEAQICCSYVISILSSLLIAGGFYLTILKWDHLWLILPIVGSILIFIGACMYYSGQMDLRRRRRRRNDKILSTESHGLGRRHRRRSNKERGHGCPSGVGGISGNGDNLISSGLNDGRSLSQLSINMIPQYFANTDLSGSLSGPASNLPYSQILRVNGQSFLILPLSGDQSSSTSTNNNPAETAISLQNLMVKMPCKTDQQSKPEGSDIYKKLEELPKRFNSKDYTTFTTEDCLPSSSVSHDERNIIGLDNRSTGMVKTNSNFTRETEPGSQSEYHFISNYFSTPGTSSSHHHNNTTTSQPEAQTSRINNKSIRMVGHAGSQSRITNQHHRSSLIQVQPISSTSSIGQASSSISSSSSSSRRPLLRRDTFNKDKPSVTIVKSTTNQSDSLHAQTTVIADPSISSSPSSSSSVVVTSSKNNKRTDNNNRSVSNSLRLLSSQPGSAGSCNSYSQSQVLMITQSNLSSNPNITSSSPTSSPSSPNSQTIPNSMIPVDSLLPDHHHHHSHRRSMDTNNPDETFIVMCGGNGGSTGDSDNLNFDENLIEPASATPPPSYEEVLSVDTVAGGPIGTRNSIAFDTL